MKREHPDSSIQEVLKRTKLVKGGSKHHATNSFVKQSAKQYELMKIDTDAYYIYPYDSWVARIVYHKKTMITSVTPKLQEQLLKRELSREAVPLISTQQRMLQNWLTGRMNEANS